MPESIYETLIQQQHAYFLSGETRDVAFRLKQLALLKQAVRRNEKLIYEALYEDLHKSKFEAYATEVGFVLEEISYQIKHLKKWVKPRRVRSPLTSFPANSYIHYEPKGNVLIMSPWNYPFQLAILPLIGAISAGNTVVLKPSEISTHTAGLIEKIIGETFEEKYVKVIIGGAKVGQSLLQLHFNHIFFTGSERVGRIVLESAASRLIPVTLELGGKNPCVVDEDVNVKLAARRIVWGKLINAGQTCIAPNCLLVHEKVKEKLLPELVAAIRQFYGDDIKSNDEYPRIINRANMERLIGLLDRSQVYWGGNYDAEELYFEPTILDKVNLDLPVVQMEIFGPIMPVLTFKDMDEMLGMIRNCKDPLALYFFSGNKKHIRRVLDEVPAGGVTINDTLMHFVNNGLPFGGTGNSGMGKYHGRYSFDVFSNRKSVVKRGTWLDVPLRYAPFKNKLNIVKKLM